MELHPTFDGKTNLDDCCHEYLISKIELVNRLCRKVRTLINMVNNWMYDMYIPADVLRSWKLMQAVHGICKKLCLRFTDYVVDVNSEAAVNSLICEREVKAMLRSIEYCSWNNPRDNITASSLDMMSRLFVKCGQTMDNHLNWIRTTHRDVQAE